jgi:hypothetical protein
MSRKTFCIACAIVFFIFILILKGVKIGKTVNTGGVSYFVINKNETIDSSVIPGRIPMAIDRVFSKHNILRAGEYHMATILFTTKLDDINSLNKIPLHESCKWIYGLRSINMLSSKAILALFIRVNYPDTYESIIPKTWILHNQADFNDLTKQFKRNKKPKFPMLLKKNVQQQKGISFVNDISDISEGKHNVVCQRILVNPFMIKGLKTNFRIYMMVSFDKELNVHVYNNGFVYYSSKPFSKHNTMYDSHITSGLKREVYENHPVSISDMVTQKYITLEEQQKLISNICQLLKKVMLCFVDLLIKNESNESDTRGPGHFVILGCDLAADDKLEVKLMEINKGPDLRIKDERDLSLKTDMIEACLRKIGVLRGNTDMLTKII